MQQIVLRTPIQAPFVQVVERFDERLFQALAPRFPKMELLRHDPITDGAEVHLLLNTGIMKQKWVSKLSRVSRTDSVFEFYDHGTSLPFPLKAWEHVHRVESREGGTSAEIIDDMRFTTGWLLLDWLAKPVLFSLFNPRKAKYVAYFEQS